MFLSALNQVSPRIFFFGLPNRDGQWLAISILATHLNRDYVAPGDNNFTIDRVGAASASPAAAEVADVAGLRVLEPTVCLGSDVPHLPLPIVAACGVRQSRKRNL